MTDYKNHLKVLYVHRTNHKWLREQHLCISKSIKYTLNHNILLLFSLNKTKRKKKIIKITDRSNKIYTSLIKLWSRT